MGAVTEALKRIEQDFEAFRAGIVRCESAIDFQRADWQDAYARLARVKDRYDKERAVLRPSERDALAKVFEHDVFIRGMMELRQVGEHVIKRTGLTIRTADNVPIVLDCQTSARAAFAAPEVTLPDTLGESHRIDHLRQLRVAEKRIESALHNARS